MPALQTGSAPMDDTLQELLRYAARQGVELTGIAPRRLPGRGYGIVATRDIEADETVLAVPTRALRTLATVPPSIARALGHDHGHDVSGHGILAAHLALDASGDYAAWDAVLPTPADLAAGMPLLWPAELQARLPGPAAAALARQQAKLARDWAGVRAGLGAAEEEGYDRYVCAWLLVNSRTFYYAAQKDAATQQDRMAMQPVADLFNHAADRGCRVTCTTAGGGFTFVADRPYGAGDEVPISYGAHANDALLVEYGFVLDGRANAAWDEVGLDAALLPRLTHRARDDLDAIGFLGRYMIDAATPGGCYRTQVALRRCLAGTARPLVAQWQQYVDGGGQGDNNNNVDDAPLSQKNVDRLLRECLDDMAEHAQAALAAIDRLAAAGVGTDAQRGLLARRWQQIESLVVQSARALDD